MTKIINWFGVIYVGIPLAFLIFLSLYFLFGGNISRENQDRIIEFSKWYIVSVAIVFAAKTIEAGFTERETGIKEMQVYDQYVETILEADNIEARWRLAEYFSTVTPTDRLRERWIAYKTLIERDYEKFKELDEKENDFLSRDTLSTDERDSLNVIQRQKAPFEKRLVDNNMGRWVIVFTADKELDPAKYELNNLIDAGIDGAKLYLRNEYYRTISKVFSSKQMAANYLSDRENTGREAYIVNLENWCSGERFNGEYYICE